eukprot:scaffold26961_cov26-Tisochrysis_lutea.AAC.1
MPGGDLMDVLVAEASVIKHRVPQGGWQVGCLAPKVKMLQVCAVCSARKYCLEWSASAFREQHRFAAKSRTLRKFP